MRTDRTHPFFKAEDNENTQKLFDILMTYCMYNFDLGKSNILFTFSVEFAHETRFHLTRILPVQSIVTSFGVFLKERTIQKQNLNRMICLYTVCRIFEWGQKL